MTEKLQNAYRRGDLDLMDSLDLLMERSDAFREKFLYRRNEIQANSIDSIIRHASLFAGVGAAHLPGRRGVIELLRKKGYTLRPVKMANRNAPQRSQVDNLKVPVVFQKKFSDDGFYSVEVPGDLYKVTQDYPDLDRKQYADMSNGSYYMVTRVKTYAAFLNQDENEVLRKIDSLLYENIPGKILSRQNITKNNYDGFDITSKTRRGDLQRYQIFVTPFEVLIFKMSGKENYISGGEAECFFSSISLQEPINTPFEFQPLQGGFSIRLPQEPLGLLNQATADNRWEYEAFDKANGDAYLLFKESIYNYNFIDEDSFDLSLIEESFHNPDLCADTANNEYLNSFSFKPYTYRSPALYTDTFFRASVITPVFPEIDGDMRKLVEQASEDALNGNNTSGYISYWAKPKRGIFKNDSTGEMISVQVQEYPDYYYIRDSARFWQNEINSLSNKHDILLAPDPVRISGKDYSGLHCCFVDTGSGRAINYLLMLKNNYLFSITSIGDTSNAGSSFITSFFNSFKPDSTVSGRDLYQNRLGFFFSDLFSKDSARQNRAQQSVSNVYYGTPGIPYITDAINRLNISDKKYFDTKTKLIAELGFIRDTSSDILVTTLKNIYEQTSDTALFRNEVVKSLAKIKTKASYRLLKEIFLQDPPIFENKYEYNNLFENLDDSLKLTAGLFPELLRLSSLDDYKEKVIDLLESVTDGGFLLPKAYKNYFPNIYIDAKVALKKQEGKDERQLRADTKKTEDDDPVRLYNSNNKNVALQNYSVLLMPYYEKNKNVRDYFSRLLKSYDEQVKLNTAVLMIRNNKFLPDSILVSIASVDKYRAILLSKLEKINQAGRFPKEFKTQAYITRSFLVAQNNFDKLDSIVFLSKQTATIKGNTGYVYFYKYRVKREDQWKIGITGLQPLDETRVNSDDDVSSMTEVRLKEDEDVNDQLSDQLKRILFGFHKSGKFFYKDNGHYNDYTRFR